MGALIGFLAFARHPLIDDAVKVTLLGNDFSLPRGIKRAPGIGVHALIVHPAALRVAQDLVGFIDLDEARLGIIRLRHVGVEPARQAAIGRFDLVGSCPIRKSENAVEVFHTVCYSILRKWALDLWACGEAGSAADASATSDFDSEKLRPT